ncbi:MAG: putative toxin-antitoxin system toxin component, PIN family [Nitrospirae bacterium]|nr:MAG: putative toxin-antitoxin system toxin component, PIN family [Nitrospirota bacterium]
MRAVIDTNVFVSSFFGGIPFKVIELWFSGKMTLCVSKPVLKEYFDVLKRFEFGDGPLLYRLMSAFEKSFNLLFVNNPAEQLWIKEDPADNKFIACAVALKAEYIISGDAHLRKMKNIGKIKIVSPAEMIAILEAQR